MTFKGFFKWMLYKKMGWTKNVTVQHPDKYIICLAPHTSNWDFVISLFYRWAEGYHIGFLMKKEWFFWPLGPIFRRLDGIPVYRSKTTRMSEQLAQRAKEATVFALAITPEGTRSLNDTWKRGFYYIALEAGIPILLYAIDYERKYIECTRTFIPTGNVEEDMTQIKQFYKDFKGKHPEKFSIGET